MPQRMVKIGFCAFLALSAVYGMGTMAASLEAAIDTQVKTDQAAAKSQDKIDALSEETTELLAEYRQVTAQLDSLRTYNRQLGKLIRSQKEEFTSLQQQLSEIEVTQREIVPLMLRMVSSLEQFVALDIPFLPQERQTRIQQLKALMDRADVGLSEKYRRVVEAFQVEVEYGRTIEAYRGTLAMEGKSRTVDFLRIGRTALFFHTLDGKTCGRWDVHKQRWSILPDRYRSAVTQGLRIARKQAPPDLLLLPIRAPETVQ
ncbi:conserved hypothetical protein [Nitrosococcus halophilus Nc 4]|uniref:TonB system biopolymer transport component n=1 Tax=Nitrosococcus halophilus (strain Nc4) TaxID=472759 RepID=D5C2V2_NITHN|nr:DUF3450 domain-containing protein [Nitrosococcus halophilus]ADE16777.1 conserved hypothetical protein [Nitrosococcus halophilus Nc 4]